MLNKGKSDNLLVEIMVRFFLILSFLPVAFILLTFTVFAATPTLRIVKPTDNTIVNGYIVEVRFETNNFILKDYRNNPRSISGQGHINLWLDREKLDSSTAQKWFRDTPYTFADVSSGNHTLVVELVGNDNEPLNPRVTQTVRFTTISDNLQKDKDDVNGKTAGGLDSVSKGLVSDRTTPSLSLNPLSRMRLPIIIGIVTLFLGILGSLVLKN